MVTAKRKKAMLAMVAQRMGWRHCAYAHNVRVGKYVVAYKVGCGNCVYTHTFLGNNTFVTKSVAW
jgi:hypothetical protein